MQPRRVALYYRYSPRPSSPDLAARIESLREYAAARHWPAIDDADVYTDEDVSRDDWERDGLWSCVESARPGTVVLTQAIDRIGETGGIVDHVMVELARRGATLWTVESGQADPQDPMACFVVDILAAVAKWQRSNIALRSRAAYQRKLAQGFFNGVHIPYGYRWVDQAAGRVEPDPAEQAIREEILRLSAEGLGWKRIALELNARGVLGRGEPWTLHRIRPIVEATLPKKRKRRKFSTNGRK